jgi:STE24 endopeptidase
MEKHNIKRYKLYVWDSSRSKESNAMVSGVRTYHLFISTTLIEDVTLPELETVITHEIGHIKNKHLIKMMISKIFVVSSLVAIALLPQILKLESLERTGFYALTILAVVLGLIISVKIERKYEDQADMYAACYNDPELCASALRKVIKYEEDTNKIDELFQSHPDIKDRIEKVKKGEF